MKYKGVRYPIEYSPKGFLHETTDINQIKSDMLIVILTLPGERPMELEFGCPLHTVNMMQPIEGIESQARMMIARSLKKWEKRVQVDDIKVIAMQTQMNQYDLRIEVSFIDPANINQLERLTVETTIGAYVYCR